MQKSPFVYDLMGFIKKNPKRGRKINASVDRLYKLEKAMLAGSVNAGREMQKELATLIKLCGYNMGLVIPFMFPTYPEDKPLSLLCRPYMFALLSMAGNSIVTFRAGRQIGKCSVGITPIKAKVDDVECDILLEELFDMGEPIT